MQDITKAITFRVASHRDAIFSFLRDLVAIPSYDGNIRAVAARVERELCALGFSNIHYVPYGDIVARIGGKHVRYGERTLPPQRTLLYDSHLETVGVGDERRERTGGMERLGEPTSAMGWSLTKPAVLSLGFAQDKFWLPVGLSSGMACTTKPSPYRFVKPLALNPRPIHLAAHRTAVFHK